MSTIFVLFFCGTDYGPVYQRTCVKLENIGVSVR